MINQKDLNKIEDDPCYKEILKENLNKKCDACFYSNKIQFLLKLNLTLYPDNELCINQIDFI